MGWWFNAIGTGLSKSSFMHFYEEEFFFCSDICGMLMELREIGELIGRFKNNLWPDCSILVSLKCVWNSEGRCGVV